MRDVLKRRIQEWRRSRMNPFTKEVAVSVLRRAAQGMDDDAICRYLDYRKRGLDRDSVEWRVLENTKASLLREGSRLQEGVQEIREALARIEEERKRIADARPAVGDEGITSRTVYELWRDELRYKNSLIPPGARGGGRSGRRRKREVKGGKIDTTPLEVVIQKHNERLLKKRA